MQIEIFKRDDIESKLKTRKLYEECFDEGKDDFIDYYYDVIIKRNEIVVAKDEDHSQETLCAADESSTATSDYLWTGRAETAGDGDAGTGLY